MPGDSKPCQAGIHEIRQIGFITKGSPSPSLMLVCRSTRPQNGPYSVCLFIFYY